MCEWPSQPPPHGGRQSGARQAKARALLGEPRFPGWGPAIPAPRRGCLASRPSQRGLCSQRPPPPEGSDLFSLPGAAGGGWPTTPPRSVRPGSRTSTSAPQRSGQPLPSGAWGRGGGPLQPGWRPGRPAHTHIATAVDGHTASRCLTRQQTLPGTALTAGRPRDWAPTCRPAPSLLGSRFSPPRACRLVQRTGQ